MKNYEKKAAVTTSPEFFPENVSYKALNYFLGFTLQQIIEIDRIKKALFYDKKYMHLMSGVKHFGGTETLTACIEDNEKAKIDLLHGILGIVSESGELIELWQKAVESGNFDKLNLKEEIGDIFWYCSLLCGVAKTNFSEVMEANIRKLRARYPNKFSTYDATHRNLQAEEISLNGFLGKK
jgi:NTP pyrophosphatase (non-canonical NTP hydrolase)